MSLTLLFGGCATGGGSSTQPVDGTGTWAGTLTGTWPSRFNFPFVAVLDQKGSTVTGNITEGPDNFNGPIQGTIAADRFQCRQTNGSAAGEVMVKGNEMNGRIDWNPAPGPASGRLNLRRR